jgi:hypothetical protein
VITERAAHAILVLIASAAARKVAADVFLGCVFSSAGLMARASGPSVTTAACGGAASPPRRHQGLDRALSRAMTT